MRSDQRKVVRLSMPAGPSTAPPTPPMMPSPEILRLLRWLSIWLWALLLVSGACVLYLAFQPQWDHPRPTELEIFPPTDTRSE